MSKVYTITINGKEEFLCGNIQKILLKSRKTGLEYWYSVNEASIKDAVEGIFTDSPEWTPIVKNERALTLNLDAIAKCFNIKGRWKNTSGYGHTSASHKSTGTEFTVFTDRIGD